MTGLVFEPLLPQWLVIVAGVIGAVFAVYGVWRSPAGGALRLAALAALFALLLNPQLRVAERTPLSDISVVIADASASQSLDGRAAATTRAAEEVADALEALGEMDVRRVDISGDEETRLVEAINAALADTPRARLASVFVVSDGQASDAADADGVRAGAPIHLLLTGRDSEIDRKLTLVNAPRYGIVNDTVSIAFRIDDFGPNETPVAATGQARVTLRIDGEEILSEMAPVGSEISFEAPLERPGRTIIELEVEERDGELTTRNNLAVLPIAAIRDRLRVLLISGEPHPGERVWRNLLKSDPAIDLVHFTILRPMEKAQSDGAFERELALIEFPQDELFIEKLSEFDLVIFDRYTYRGVLSAFHFDNIARYVEDGGAVLVASGPEYNGVLSLAARRNFSFILPALPLEGAVETPFRPRISEEGLRHPVTADLPETSIWGRWLRIMPVAMRSGRALMEGPNDAPLLILDRVGAGRVGLLLSDHVWLWARGFDGGGPHAELLRRVAHWLMKEPELEEEQLILRGLGEDLEIERRTMTDAPGPVTLTDPEGETMEIELTQNEDGRFIARLPDARRGLYRARDGELFAVGVVGLAAAPEFLDVVSEARKLGPAVEASGGGVFNIRRGEAVALPAIRRVSKTATQKSGAGWAGVLRQNASRTDAVNDEPLAPPVVWLVLIALALIGAWWVEGRKTSSAGDDGSSS